MGRYKLNAASAPHRRAARHPARSPTRDIIELIKELIAIPEDPRESAEEIDEENRSRTTRPRPSPAARADRRPPRRVRALRQPPPAHGRRADPGGVPDRPLPDGAGGPRAPHHRGRRHDHAPDHHQHPPVVAALKEFFGSSQLSQFMDQTNSLAGLTHRRRLSALGAGGLTRERAPIEVRDVHPTHYGRMCPIETPEGPNIGLIGSLSSYAEVSEHGFVTTPTGWSRTAWSPTRSSTWTPPRRRRRASPRPTPRSTRRPASSRASVSSAAAARRRASSCRRSRSTLMDVSPAQIWSVATALIPFLEHDDANRALMGSNMQRQAELLLKTEPPLIGTGMERRAAVDTGDVVLAEEGGTVTSVDAERIVVTHGDEPTSTTCDKFMRSNQGTMIHQSPVVSGEKVKEGHVLADGSSTDRGELALGKNCLVAFMSWEGLQLRGRDHHLGAPRQGRRAHLDPHRGVRDRRAAPPSWATRRSPGTSRTAPRSRSATSTTAASFASAPKWARATCWSARSRRRARPS